MGRLSREAEPSQTMNRRFYVKPLSPERIDATFPIVQAANPGLTLAQWRRFAENPAGSAGPTTAAGILVVENEREYVQGFCTYRLQSDIRHGTILVVSDLVTLALVSGEAAAAALVDSLQALARRLGCGAVRLHVEEAAEAHGGGPMLYHVLRQGSHVDDASRLVRPVDLILD